MPPIDTVYDLIYGFRDPREEAYLIAANRTRRSHDISAWEDDTTSVYDLANHIANVIADRRQTHTETIYETCLHEHIEQWKSDTIYWSSMARRLLHPSYIRIVGLAQNFTNHEVERALLHELQTD